MSYLIKKILMTFTILPVVLLSNTNTTQKNLAIYHTISGNVEKQYNNLIERKIKSIGFNVTDAHKRVNDQYEVKWGSTQLDVLSFMPIVRDSTILPLLNIDPRIAGFAPFNVALHKKRDENVSYVGHLVPEVMLDMLGINNVEVRKKFSAPFKALDATIAQELGGDVRTIPYKSLPKNSMMNYEYSFQTPKDMEDFIDEFQETFESAFIKKGYLIAGYHNFMEATDDAKEILSDYDAFWTYSLCHLEFSYNMFDTHDSRPEASLFAPCSMYMYIKKGSNKVVIGMIRLQNWGDALDIKSKKRANLIQKLDTEIPMLLEELGMKSVANVNPLLNADTVSAQEKNHVSVKNAPIKHTRTSASANQEQTSITSTVQTINVGNHTVKITLPTVPTPIKCAASKSGAMDRNIKFSKRIPPNYKPHSFDKAQKEKNPLNTRIGEVNNGKISAYLRGPYLSVEEASNKLKKAGFHIISTNTLTNASDLTSIVFSDDTLLSMSNKVNRGFIASLRVLIDDKEKRMSITNPLYIAKGFMQNDFDEKNANIVLSKLLTQFENLKNSKDTLKFQLLPKYQFMNGMPKYQDMIEVAMGDNLLAKITSNKHVLFQQKLNNGATLIGIELSKRTRKFIKRIGRNNAAMLPYPILIENGKAKILDPKYYISFMYPLLTMSEFMTIATIPDAMVKDCEKIFK